MSRLAELIEELCPDGVEYRTLGELGSFFGGLSGKSKSDFVEIENAHPFVTYKEVYSLIEIAQCPQGRVAVLPHEKQLALCRGDVLFTGSSENADEVGLTAVVTIDFSEPVYLNSFSMCLRWCDATFDSGYAKYLFTSSEVRRQIRRCASGVTRFNLSKKRLEGVRIPIPPLEVQREIARILDQFTTLEAELEAELEARRTQYEHYRNHLLSYESLASRGPVDMVELGSVVTLLDSRRIPLKKGDRVSGEYPYYGASGIVDYVDSYIFDEDLLLVSEDGANLKARTKPIAFSTSGRVWVNNHAHVLKVESPLYQKFLEEYLNSLDLEPYLVGSTQPKLNQSGLLSIPVPLPTERALERSVLLLEKLKLFVTDFSSGLPAEIAARRAQYEHYRDRLLSFREKAVSGSDAS